MKKVFLFLLITCSLALTSCSEDDSDEATAEQIAEATDSNGNSIIGLWTMTWDENFQDQISTLTNEFNFNADKTGTYKRTETGEADINESFTWTRSADIYTVNLSAGSTTLYIEDFNGEIGLFSIDEELTAVKQ